MTDHSSVPWTPQRGDPSAAADRRSAANPHILVLARPAVMGLFVLVAWLGLWSLVAVPDVVPATASPLAFSAERAMTDLRAVAAAPRPAGSPNNAAARDYLLARLAALGLEPQVQSTHVLRHSPGFPETHLMAVENVLVRVPGAESGGPALLVSGHYDSVAASAGAGDCGACVAVVLETLRAVLAAADAGQPLRNDVIFLFTDGEELGVAGAEGFMRDHPWAAGVGLSLVFEGLGSDGAPLLYVAAHDAGAVVADALAALEDGARFPLASSFLHSFMWAVAGNTGSDLDAFAPNAPGLGLIYLSLDTAAAYHASADDAVALDPRSLQGLGDFALTLTRHFGNRPLADLSPTPDLIAFPLLPGLVARYSSAAALPLAVVAAALLLAALVVGVRRGELSGRGLLAGLGYWLLSMVSAVLLVSLAWWLTRLLTPTLHNFTVGGWWGSGFYLAASLALALGVAAGWRVLLRRVAPADLWGGGMVWWAGLALLTAAALPGLGYLFVWPVLAWAAAWLVAALLPGGEWRRALPPVVAAAVAVLLAAPVAWWMWIYAGRAEGLMGLPMAALPVLFVLPALMLVLLAVELTPGARHVRTSRRRAWLVLASFALAVLLFALPALAGPSPARPWANTVVYTLDAGQGAAHWVTFNDSRAGRGTRHQLDEWTGQFFAAGAEATTFDPWLLTRSDTPYPALRSAAPAANLPRTVIAPDETGRSLRLVRPAEAWLTRLVVRSAAPLTGIALDGAPLDLGGTRPNVYTFLIIGRADEVAFDLTTDGAGGIEVELLDRLNVDLAAVAAQTGLTVTPRPAWMMVAPAADTADGALVSSTYHSE